MFDTFGVNSICKFLTSTKLIIDLDAILKYDLGINLCLEINKYFL